ncbi:MAG: hypothetical protein R3E87_04050 [Burkholderiaceae bacterium]
MNDSATASQAIAAQARLHHQFFLGLQLAVSMQAGAEVVGDWMFRLFRRQHEVKFLASFAKLGLDGLPHAVACARYHVLSNAMGGVAVEYMEESDTKAWVRFRYPRWMVDGPTICGVPVEAGRGFLRGWYAHNGVSLGNPRLGFVCVSEDMTGQYGLCGYFREYPTPLDESGRLVFAPDERPPRFDPAAQPAPPALQWSAERLAKANRNYAVEYIRNGIEALVQTIGSDRALEIAMRAARLTGLQQYSAMAGAVGAVDAGPTEAAAFLAAMFAGMGDRVSLVEVDGAVCIEQRDLRIVRDLAEAFREPLLAVWAELWRGAIHAHRQFLELSCQPLDDDGEAGLRWTIGRR